MKIVSIASRKLAGDRSGNANHWYFAAVEAGGGIQETLYEGKLQH
jgi:hypothetical protein